MENVCNFLFFNLLLPTTISIYIFKSLLTYSYIYEIVFEIKPVESGKKYVYKKMMKHKARMNTMSRFYLKKFYVAKKTCKST